MGCWISAHDDFLGCHPLHLLLLHRKQFEIFGICHQYCYVHKNKATCGINCTARAQIQRLVRYFPLNQWFVKKLWERKFYNTCTKKSFHYKDYNLRTQSLIIHQAFRKHLIFEQYKGWLVRHVIITVLFGMFSLQFIPLVNRSYVTSKRLMCCWMVQLKTNLMLATKTCHTRYSQTFDILVAKANHKPSSSTQAETAASDYDHQYSVYGTMFFSIFLVVTAQL